MSDKVVLKRFELIAGGQFNSQKPSIVVDLTKSSLIGVKADEEEGKSTLVEMILLNTGMVGGEQVIKDLINRETGELKSKLDYSVGKNNFEVTQSKGVLTVRKDGDKEPGGAQTLLRQTLGMVGVSPMGIKNEPIEKIVKWLAGYSASGADEFEKKMLKLKADIKTAKAARASANKSSKGLREFLAGEGYIDAKGDLIEKAWKASEEKYKKKVEVKEVSARLEKAGQDADKYLRAEEKLKNHKAARPADLQRIEDLKAQLKVAEAALAQRDKDISAAERYLLDNKADKTKYDEVKTEFENVSKDAIAYDKWQDVKRKKKEMDEFEDASIKADGIEKAALKKQQELQWEVIPDLPGTELLLEDEDDGEGNIREAGYYLKGMNSRQMSASQWFGQVIQILKKNKVKFLVIDDISQYGSTFMDTLKMASKTCTILYTEMSRGTQELVFDYNTK